MRDSHHSLTGLSQAASLAGEQDPEVRRGICVALCDFWLESIRGQPNRSAGQRLQALAAKCALAVQHQKDYSQLRQEHGREAARRQIGERLSLAYEEQTTIMRVAVGIPGIKD